MNKTAIIYEVAQKNDLSFAAAERIVNAFLDEVGRALSNGERVTISGFGTFEVRKRKARVGRIPKTGEQVQIPEHLTPAFMSGLELKRKVEGKE